MLRRIDLRDKQGPVDLHLPRPDFDDQAPISDVRKIISGVREGGDASIRELTKKFDSVDVVQPLVSQNELEEAWRSLGSELAEALEFAHDRILHFPRSATC